MTNQLQRNVANLRNSIYMETPIFVKIEKINLGHNLTSSGFWKLWLPKHLLVVHFPYRIMQAPPPLNFWQIINEIFVTGLVNVKKIQFINNKQVQMHYKIGES